MARLRITPSLQPEPSWLVPTAYHDGISQLCLQKKTDVIGPFLILQQVEISVKLFGSDNLIRRRQVLSNEDGARMIATRSLTKQSGVVKVDSLVGTKRTKRKQGKALPVTLLSRFLV